MKLSYIFLLLVAYAAESIAQKGSYSLSHFSPAQERSDYLSFDLKQDERGIIYIAGKEGVEEFDGRRWRLIPTPGVAYTLAKTSSSIVVGGLDGFGQVIEDPQKGWTYQAISQGTQAKNIFGSLTHMDSVYLINDSNLFILSPTSPITTNAVNAPNGIELSGIFELMGQIYIISIDSGLFVLENNKLVPSTVSITDSQILFVEKFNDSENYLIGTASNQLFLYAGAKGLSEIKVNDQSYLNSHVISDGVWLNEQVIAIGTLRGGVMFINLNTGDTEEIIDYDTGLPDNEVFALLCDKRQGIWVAHSYGYTRIATNIPFRSFSHYNGLSGKLLCVQSINGKLYAGTSVGLFILTQQEVYEEEVYYVTQKSKGEKKTQEPQVVVKQTKPEERQRAKRGLFGFLKKEKQKSENLDKVSSGTAIPLNSTAKVAGPTEVVKRERRTRKVLRSVNYTYQKINGIEGKVTQLWNLEGKLLAAGPSGLYEVKGELAKVISDDPIRSFTVTKDRMTLVASTYDDEVKTFSSMGKEWSQTNLLDTLHTFVSFLFEDKQQNIWLCGLNAIYKAEIDEGELVDIVEIPFSNPSMAETFGMAAGSDVVVVIAGKFLRFDLITQKFITYDSLGSSGKSLVSGNRFWYFDGHNWSSPDQKLGKKFNLKWLNLFPEIRFISPDDKNENLWVITTSNELYKFTSDTVLADVYQYPLFLKDVRNQQAKLLFTSQNVELSQELGAVTFEFIQPEYSGLQTTEYRYWVKGLQRDWSAWSAINNELNFPYIPVGSYKILIQSKNLFGQIAEIEPVNFEVVPPYWKRAWFYAAEVAIFSFLVMLSIRLSVMNERYRFISKLLSLLTIILLIQLIQTSVYSLINITSTPVVDFFIQVSIALLVLPLEFSLRKIMDMAADGNFSLSKLFGRS
jgi:ligand-binding sensor domain-containing protein